MVIVKTLTLGIIVTVMTLILSNGNSKDIDIRYNSNSYDIDIKQW